MRGKGYEEIGAAAEDLRCLRPPFHLAAALGALLG